MSTRPKYQREPVELRDLIWTRGLIEPWELLQICAWKSAKGLAPISLNDEAIIRDTTAKVCEVLRPMRELDVLAGEPDWRRWEQGVGRAIGSKVNGTGLLGLAGIGYAMSTAILCILNPSAFPVLDRWAILGVYGGVDKRSMLFYEHAARYCEYAQDLASRSREATNAKNIHEVDQHFMRAGMPPRTAHRVAVVQGELLFGRSRD